MRHASMEIRAITFRGIAQARSTSEQISAELEAGGIDRDKSRSWRNASCHMATIKRRTIDNSTRVRVRKISI